MKNGLEYKKNCKRFLRSRRRRSMDKYLKLTEAPTLVFNNPECGTCMEELSSDADGWMCGICGSCWGFEDGDADQGLLYEDWAGEELEGPELSEEEAFEAACKIRARGYKNDRNN